MHSRGFKFIATFRINRFNIDLSSTELEFKKKPRGTIETYSSLNSQIAIVRWLDSKAVYFISNFKCDVPVGSIYRHVKESRAKKLIKCPAIVKAYNEYMGGVDLSNMLHSLYRINRRSKRWYMRIIYYLLAVCMTNSWIMYERSSCGIQTM